MVVILLRHDKFDKTCTATDYDLWNDKTLATTRTGDKCCVWCERSWADINPCCNLFTVWLHYEEIMFTCRCVTSGHVWSECFLRRGSNFTHNFFQKLFKCTFMINSFTQIEFLHNLSTRSSQGSSSWNMGFKVNSECQVFCPKPEAFIRFYTVICNVHLCTHIYFIFRFLFFDFRCAGGCFCAWMSAAEVLWVDVWSMWACLLWGE